jgi:solute:Na+ symporter, SSS family
MTPWDYLIIVVYFSLIITVGVAFRSQKSLRDYFLGGNNVPWWAATFSGIATILSAVSYIGAPGMAYAGDYRLHQYRLGLPFAIVMLCVIMLPFFYRTQRYSIYEYIQERFDERTRLFVSGLFVVLKTCFLGLAIYAPALVIRQMFGVSIWYIVAFVGFVTTLYTMLGGIKAVIWTDSVQLFILLGGLFVVAGIALAGIDGGLAEVIAIGQAQDKFRVWDFSWDLDTTFTVWAGLVGGGVFLLAQYGTDQAELQRFLATRSLRDARLAIIVTLVVTFAVGVGTFFIGSILFAFYTQFPDKGGLGMASNDVFPKFIVEELPIGVTGLIIAAVLAAAMSTISSVLNSVTTVIISDFYNRFTRHVATVTVARIVTVALGLVGVLLGGFAGSLGNILEMSMKLSGFFGGPMVGLFLLGMTCRRATGNGAFLGLWLGIGVTVTLGLLTNVSFLWYAAFSAGITYATGFIWGTFKPAQSSNAT